MFLKKIKIKSCFLYLLLIISLSTKYGCINQTDLKNDDCKEFNSSYSKEIKLLQNKDTLAFVKWLTSIIKNNSICIDAYLTRADVYFFQDSLLPARNDYLKVVAFDSSNTYSLYQLGILYHIRNLEDSAIYFFEKSLDTKKSKNSDIIIDYHTINKNLSTKEDKYDIPYSEIIYQMGISFYYRRELDEALKNFDFCINSNYKISDVLLYRGAVYFEIGKKKLACADFFKSKELNNSEAQTYIDKYCKD